MSLDFGLNKIRTDHKMQVNYKKFITFPIVIEYDESREELPFTISTRGHCIDHMVDYDNNSWWKKIDYYDIEKLILDDLKP